MAFSKAFDPLDYKLLISKHYLFELSTCTIRLIEYYLINRLLSVFYNNAKSGPFIPTSGVP